MLLISPTTLPTLICSSSSCSFPAKRAGSRWSRLSDRGRWQCPRWGREGVVGGNQGAIRGWYDCKTPGGCVCTVHRGVSLSTSSRGGLSGRTLEEGGRMEFGSYRILPHTVYHMHLLHILEFDVLLLPRWPPHNRRAIRQHTTSILNLTA